MTAFVGIDWAEMHQGMRLLDTEGRILAQRQILDGLEGVALLWGLLATHIERPLTTRCRPSSELGHRQHGQCLLDRTRAARREVD